VRGLPAEEGELYVRLAMAAYLVTQIPEKSKIVFSHGFERQVIVMRP
jgi:hypothetical protein